MKPIQHFLQTDPLIPLQSDLDLIGDLLGLPADRIAESLSSFTLRDLGSLTEPELLEAGLSPARARRLHRALELARRFARSGPRLQGRAFTSPKAIADHFLPKLRDEKQEHFYVVTLDARHRILREHLVSKGSLSTSIVHPREVFRAALRDAAGAIVLVINHPSGDSTPSEEDIAVTRRLIHAADLIGIRILDHVVVGDGKWESLRERGML